jgi:hypothetical protein
MSVVTGAKKGDEVAKEIEKDLAFLKAEQRKRLRELTWQLLASIPAGSTVLSRDAGSSAELKLTKDQKEKLGNRELLDAVLTDEQKKALKALGGKPAPAEVVQLVPGWGRGPRVSAVPTVLQYLENAAVATELKTTEKQKETFAALAKKWRDKVPSRSPFANVTPAKAKEARELADAIEKDAKAALTPEQAKRLAQIVMQNEKRGLRGERDIFTIPAIAEGLKLTDGQKKKLAEIVEKRQKGLLPIFTGDGEAKDILAAVQKHNDETQKLLLAELSAEQKKALDTLFGKPFAGLVQTRAFLPLVRDGGGPSFPTARTPMHLCLTARLYLASDDLHKELGLTADQKKKLTALAGPVTATRGADEKKMAELAAATEKELAAILKPEQMKRLVQVMLQQYGRGAFPFSPTVLPRFVEVRKGLGLTKDQLDKLSSRGVGPRGSGLESVLTEAQKAKWKEMLGKATEVRLMPPGFSGFGTSLPPDVALLQNAGVAADLKFTAAQKEKLTGIGKAYQEASTAARSDPNFQEYRKKLAAARTAAEAGMAKLLDDDQKKRLVELKLQQAKRSGLYTLLARPAVVTALKITADQRGRITAAYDGARTLRTALSREYGSTRARVSDAEATKAFAVIEANAEKRMEAALTKDQHDALKKLLGQPFKGTLPRAGGFWPGGGAGGGGGLGGGFGGGFGGAAPPPG